MGGLVMGACLAAVLMFSSEAMAAASQAAQLFASGVMPALLPMMVLCRLFAPGKNHEHSPVRDAVGAVLFSFASGSPASAQRLDDLWCAGAVSPRALEPLLAACGVMSPMFFVGTLATWTGLKAGCWAMLACHWLGALATAGLVRLMERRGSAVPSRKPAAREQSPSLPAAVAGAATALVAVCGAMMAFAAAAGVIKALLTALFPAWMAEHRPLVAAVWALMEVGGGAAAVLEAFPRPPLPLLCALCSFGGLSIWLQNLMFVDRCVRPVKLLMMRMLHGALSLGFSLTVFSLFPGLTRPF